MSSLLSLHTIRYTLLYLNPDPPLPEPDLKPFELDIKSRPPKPTQTHPNPPEPLKLPKAPDHQITRPITHYALRTTHPLHATASLGTEQQTSYPILSYPILSYPVLSRPSTSTV